MLEVDRDLAVVQVFEGTSGLSVDGIRVSFQGSPMRIPVGESWLGRVCNGRGAPLDGGPPVRGTDLREIGGWPINPAYRATPSDPILTGVSVVDGLATLVRGQKLPIFSVGGLPHLELAAQIAAQATVRDEPFAVVFAAMGVTNADAAAMRERLETRATTDDLVVFLNTADDPLVERIMTPRLALTVAEHLAFDLGRHVLVVMADMTSYCEAVREVASSRGEIPSRRGYPGYLYSDLASLYERAGRIQGKPGSLTQIPVLTMPGEDITHPVPDLTGYITEGQIVLSHDLHVRGVYPPFDPLRSLSRLMRLGAGEGKTRGDHLELAAQLYALVAQARRVVRPRRGRRCRRPQRGRGPLPRLRGRVRVRVRAARRPTSSARSTRRSTAAGRWPRCCRAPELTMVSEAIARRPLPGRRRCRSGFHRVGQAGSGSCGASRSQGAASTSSTRNARRSCASSSGWRSASPAASRDWELKAHAAADWNDRALAIAGERRLRLAAGRVTRPCEVEVEWRNALGTVFPAGAPVRPGPAPDFVALGGGSVVALAARAHADAVAAAAEHAAARAAYEAITAELAATTRRQRAIERRWIPEHESGAPAARARARRARARGHRPGRQGFRTIGHPLARIRDRRRPLKPAPSCRGALSTLTGYRPGRPSAPRSGIWPRIFDSTSSLAERSASFAAAITMSASISGRPGRSPSGRSGSRRSRRRRSPSR